MKYAAYALSYLPCLMLAFSAAMKFMGGAEFEKGFAHLGWPLTLAMPLGVLELACTSLYLIPATSVLGAILLTGYLGGAMAAHVRVGDPWVVQLLLGVALWGGLWLRDARLKALIPLKK
jgi:hypothetical protein